MTAPVLWLEQAVGHHVDGDLNAMDAMAVTAKIKAYAGVAWVLLVEAHNRKAHKALGYGTWAEYVEAEFDMSRSRSYQLISQARVVMEISEAVSTDVDVSTMVDITEREARDLAPIVDEAKAAAVEAVEALPKDAPAEDKADAVRDALDRLRTTAVEAKRPKAPAPTETAGPGEPPQEHGPSPAGSPAPPTPAQGGTEGYRAACTKARSTVRSHLLTLDPERVIATADEPNHWRQFSEDVRGWLDELDEHLSGPALKAVQ